MEDKVTRHTGPCGHGDHNEALLGNLGKEEFIRHIQDTISSSRYFGQTTQCVDTDGQWRDRILTGLKTNAKYLQELAVLVSSRTSNELGSFYPMIRQGTEYTLIVREIIEWSNGFEAVIRGEYIIDDDNPKEICFFDTLYWKNKGKYQIGKPYNFVLGALAYSAEVQDNPSFKFEGQKAIDWLAKTGQEPIYDERGEVEPVVFDMSNLVACIQINDDFPEDTEYQSPIKEVTELEYNGDRYYKLEIVAHRSYDGEKEMNLPLYVRADKFADKPQLSQSVRGMCWLQGYLRDKNIKRTYDPSTHITSFVDSQGDQAIFKDFMYKGYRDEDFGKPLDSPFPETIAFSWIEDMFNLYREAKGHYPNHLGKELRTLRNDPSLADDMYFVNEDKVMIALPMEFTKRLSEGRPFDIPEDNPYVIGCREYALEHNLMPVLIAIEAYNIDMAQTGVFTQGADYHIKVRYVPLDGKSYTPSTNTPRRDLLSLFATAWRQADMSIVAPYLSESMQYHYEPVFDTIASKREFLKYFADRKIKYKEPCTNDYTSVITNPSTGEEVLKFRYKVSKGFKYATMDIKTWHGLITDVYMRDYSIPAVEYGKSRNEWAMELSHFMDSLETIDFEHFDNLMPLLTALDTVSIDYGYELDGFKVGDSCASGIRLYCCKECSGVQYVSGQEPPMKYEDFMYIHNMIPQSEARLIPKVWNHLKVENSAKGAWQACILEYMATPLMPLVWHAGYIARKFILSFVDLKDLPVDCSEFCNDESILPGVRQIEGAKYKVSHTYWNPWNGLVRFSTIVEIKDGRPLFSDEDDDVLIPYDCGIRF